MRCENLFCIYWSEENICILDEIELDIQGKCNSCTYVNLDVTTLSQMRQMQLNNRLNNEI